MSWTDELYKVYENNCGISFYDGGPLPVSHLNVDVQIELTIDDAGNFVTARMIDKSEADTVIPVTENSGGRTSNICPHPLVDEIFYIAGDYTKFSSSKRSEKGTFDDYISQLKIWSESEYSHPAVAAIYNYLKKSCLISDLISCGLIILDEKTGEITKKQEEYYVRFRVNYLNDMEHENRTWRDVSLFESFQKYNNTLLGKAQLCYATGEILPSTYNHPKKICNSSANAKLISANEDKGSIFTGRFGNKEEALSVSYDFSQKMHNALKWLLAKQGFNLGSLSVTVWASAMQTVPNIMADSSVCYMDEFPDDDFAPDTEVIHAELVRKMITGYKRDYTPETKVMIMGVDAATTGRLSVSMYSELENSAFFENIESWHNETAWTRFDAKKSRSLIKDFSLYEIARCAFGTEQGDRIECKPGLMSETVLRLIPCVTERRPIPKDIVSALYRKASNPLAYNNSYNHRTVLETACGMIRKYDLKNGGIIAMGYDPNETDRSYLYGCLLAAADAAESSAYDKDDRGKRITNARRYWNSFSAHPCRTWKVIEERLLPYINKLGAKSIRYEKLIQEIKGKMTMESFNDDSPLEPAYLLGYSHFMSKIFTSDKNDNGNEEN